MENLDKYQIYQIPNKNILGRNVKDAMTSKNPLALFWSASGIEICTNASELWVQVSSDYSVNEIYLAVQISGYTIARFMAPKEKSWICVAKNLNPQEKNNISIIKDSQPSAFDPNHIVQIHQIAVTKNAEFFQVPKKDCFIEFIGDSITSGEGLCGRPEAPEWISSYISVSNNYAMQIAKIKNAEISIISQCGWGITRGWDSNINSNIPSHYQNVCSIFNSPMQKELGSCQEYDFSKKADFVVVNLGTNDNSSFNNSWTDESTGKVYQYQVNDDGTVAESSKKEIYEGIKKFLYQIRKNNPSAKILWVWGMLKLDKIPAILQNAMEDYKKESGDKNVFSLELDAMEDVENHLLDKGSRWHPGPKTHELAAKKISQNL
ncbi:MAG: hypothetical protein E7059_02875 [Treponema bryantii]|nr:hypothetical protein [Treponema bryantii]